jgi:hypothetical protein
VPAIGCTRILREMHIEQVGVGLGGHDVAHLSPEVGRQITVIACGATTSQARRCSTC